MGQASVKRQDPRPSRLLPWTLGLAVVTVLGTVLADVWLDIDYQLTANVALLAAATLVATFTLLYGFRSKWWANRIGRIYLVKCVVLSIVLTQAGVASWAEDYPYRQQIRFVIYTCGALVYVPMLVTLWREQQRDRRAAARERSA
jgi:hypothetical protein